MLIPNVFSFVAEDEFTTEDLLVLNRIMLKQKESEIDEEEDDYDLHEENNKRRRKFDYPSEILESIIRNGRINNNSIKDTSIKALEYGIHVNYNKIALRTSIKVKAMTSDADEGKDYKASILHDNIVSSLALSDNTFALTDEVLNKENLKDIIKDYEFVKEKFLVTYGIDLSVLLTNSFKGERVAIDTLVELIEEHEDLEEVMEELLSLARESKIDLFDMKGGF